MNERYKIPSIYQKMHKKGYTSIDNYLWLNEMRWIPVDKILGYQHDEGESESILPFAITGGVISGFGLLMKRMKNIVWDCVKEGSLMGFIMLKIQKMQ